jgi:hypothetical protein
LRRRKGGSNSGTVLIYVTGGARANGRREEFAGLHHQNGPFATPLRRSIGFFDASRKSYFSARRLTCVRSMHTMAESSMKVFCHSRIAFQAQRTLLGFGVFSAQKSQSRMVE